MGRVGLGLGEVAGVLTDVAGSSLRDRGVGGSGLGLRQRLLDVRELPGGVARVAGGHSRRDVLGIEGLRRLRRDRHTGARQRRHASREKARIVGRNRDGECLLALRALRLILPRLQPFRVQHGLAIGAGETHERALGPPPPLVEKNELRQRGPEKKDEGAFWAELRRL